MTKLREGYYFLCNGTYYFYGTNAPKVSMSLAKAIAEKLHLMTTDLSVLQNLCNSLQKVKFVRLAMGDVVVPTRFRTTQEIEAVLKKYNMDVQRLSQLGIYVYPYASVIDRL